MQGRRTVLAVWAVTTLIVALVGMRWYTNLTAPGDLPGRDDLAAVLDDPSRLFDDPAALGSAIEGRAFAAVAQCMRGAGFDYRSPVSVSDPIAGPGEIGYGISAGVAVPAQDFSEGLPQGADREAYEQALYGSSLADGGGTSGCASVGEREVAAAAAMLDSLPYSLGQLEADATSHSAYGAALGEWRECMRDAGWPYESPDAILADLRARLSTVGGAEARALAAEEREIAVADDGCRTQTIDRAMPEIAEDIAPDFVEANRTQLEALVPPGPGEPVLPLTLGGGDIQVTLRWDTETDLDLYVVDPGGATVSHGNRSVPSGGTLDRDANAGCGIDRVDGEFIENVFWPEESAPAGTYTARVRVFSMCSVDPPVDYELIVQVDGRAVDWVRSEIESGNVEIQFEVSG